MENIREWVAWCEKGSSRYAVPRKDKGLVPIPLIVVPNGERHYLPSFSTEVVVQEKIVLKEMVTKNQSSVLVCEERNRKVDPKLCIHR